MLQQAMKATLLSIALVLCSSIGLAADLAAATRPYEKTLYELGAFPVARLTKPYWSNGNPGQVYGKGERLDVDGWLPPYGAPSHLTDAEKAKYGIPKPPLTYEKYVSMLDIETYKRTRDPQLLLVMRFTLETMAYKWDELRTAHGEKAHVNKEDILPVYEARIGLEAEAIRLLRGEVSSIDVMRLMRTYGDENLIGIFPAPQPGEKEYLAFLNQQAGIAKWSIRSRQLVYILLFTFDEKTYRKPYREFLLTHVKEAKDWWERARLYEALLGLREEECFKAVREGLVHDPVTECRESILYEAKERGEVTPLIDAILVIADGRDDQHHAVTPAGPPGNEWSYRLSEYLTWAKSLKTLDAATTKKVDEAREKIAKNPEFDPAGAMGR